MTTTDLPFDAPHPGETLWEDFLKPMGISQVEFARHIGVSFRRVNEIINGKRGIRQRPLSCFRKRWAVRPGSGWTSKRCMTSSSTRTRSA